MVNQIRPHTSILVNFERKYRNVCDSYTNPEHREQWFALGDLLANEPYWSCEIDSSNELRWSYANMGGSWLNIGATKEGLFTCFDYYQDEANEYLTIDEVPSWITSHEEEAKKKGLKDWRWWGRTDNLEFIPFELNIDYSNGMFVGKIKVVPEDRVIARDLPDTIIQATRVLADFLQIETKIITNIRFETTLTSRATLALLNN